MNYSNFSPDVRQWRVCLICGFMQDEVVTVNAILQVSPDSNWPPSVTAINSLRQTSEPTAKPSD